MDISKKTLCEYTLFVALKNFFQNKNMNQTTRTEQNKWKIENKQTNKPLNAGMVTMWQYALTQLSFASDTHHWHHGSSALLSAQ